MVTSAGSVTRTEAAAQDPSATATHKSTRPAKSRPQLADRSATQPRLPGSEARRNVSPEEMTFIAAVRDTLIGDTDLKLFFVCVSTYCRVLEKTRLGRCTVRYATIAADLEMNPKTVKRRISHLKRCGRVTITRHRGAATIEVNAEPAGLRLAPQEGTQLCPLKKGHLSVPSEKEYLRDHGKDPDPETATTPVVVSGSSEYKPRSGSAHARGDREQSAADTARPSAAPRDDVFSRDPETTKSRKADTEPARVRTVEVDPEDREFFKVARRRRRERQAASAAAWTMTPPDPNPADPRRASVRQVALIRKLTRRFNQQHPTEEEARGLTGAQADKTIRLLTDLERTAGIAPTAQPSIAAALPATVRTAPAAGPAATERAARVETCPHPAADRATDGPFCNRCGATVEA